MKRVDFLKSIIGGTVVVALSPLVLVEAKKVTDIVVFGAFTKANCYSFKITHELYNKLTLGRPLTGIWSPPLHPLDQLCKDLTGYPIKQIGFEDDDFANNYYTVVSFRREIENEKT